MHPASPSPLPSAEGAPKTLAMNNQDLGALFAGGAIFAAIAVALLVMALLMAIPAVLSFVVLNRIPEAHRKQTPAMAFLLLIPLFSLVWAFFVYPRIAESLKSYFDSKGDTSRGDCGAQLALWLCISSIASFVPFIGMFSGIASLVLMILFFVKAFELSALAKNQ